MNSEVKKMLTDWLNKRPNWIQYIFTHVLEENTPTSVENADKIVDKMICRDSFKIAPFNFSEKSTTVDKSRLLSLNHVHNVSAIESDEGIVFSEDEPTVIFGANGSGKSSYIRILKKMSGNDPQQVLLKNVYTKNDKEQQARLQYRLGEKTYTKTLNDFTDDTFLKNVQIFDTEISNRYINQGNESSYEPLILSSLKQLIQSMAIVNERLHERKKALLTKNLPEISDDRLKIDEDIRMGQKLYDIKKIETFSVDDEDRIATLTKIFQTQNIKQRLINLKKHDEAIQSVLNNISSLLRIFNEKSINEFHGLLKSLEENKVLKSNLENTLLENKSTDSSAIFSNNDWNKMWQYACSYIGNHEDNDTCVLCGQALEGSYKKKYNDIRSFFNNQINNQIKVIEKRLSDFRKKFPDPNILKSLIESSFIVLEISDQDKHIVLQKQKIIYDEISDLSKMSMIGYNSLIFLTDFYSSVRTKNQKEMELLSEKDNAESVTVLKSELIALHQKKYFFQNKELIQQNNITLEKIKIIQGLLKETNTTSVTKLINGITDILITQTYIDKFNAELLNLMKGRNNIAKVRMIKEPPRKGRILLSLKISGRSDVEVPNVLSEGEKRIVSLAAFLADSDSSGSNTPLIIDDPITSLDMEFETAVIKRLAELSDERQIIIFTHRLSLVKQVRNIKKDTKFLELYTIGQNKGIPIGMSFDKIGPKDFNKLVPRLNAIKQLDDSPEKYRTSLWQICQDFRKMVEKSIEDILIGGIVSRYNPEVKSMQVKRLGHITSDDCLIIDVMMSKYSNYEHSQSDEYPTPEPDLIELEEDISKFSAWAKEAKKRLNDSIETSV